MAGADYNGKNPLRIFDTVYETILDRKKNPKEGSYTNYLMLVCSYKQASVLLQSYSPARQPEAIRRCLI